MSIFISYNHQDRQFAETLARNLVHRDFNVWIDQWELQVGDSLIEKVQGALSASSAVLAVLSKNSVESTWCRKEVSSALIRELDERNSILLPIVIDDCDIPLFLRDKMWADFRSDPDGALAKLCRALARFNSANQGRVEHHDFNTDWSIDYATAGAEEVIQWTFVDHGDKHPYVVLSSLVVFCPGLAGVQLRKARSENLQNFIAQRVLGAAMHHLLSMQKKVLIDTAFEKHIRFEFTTIFEMTYEAVFKYRRLGPDNGMSTLFDFEENLQRAYEHLCEVTKSAAKARAAGAKS